MTTLADVLAKKKLVKDAKTAVPLIEEGFVRLHRVLITRADLPIASEDEGGVAIDSSAKKLASAPYDYWKWREMQKKWGIFDSTSAALCFGLEEGDLTFLADREVSITLVLMENEPAWKMKEIDSKKIEIVRGNPIYGDLSSKLDKKIFTLLICGLNTNLYNIFKVIEQYAPLLLSSGWVVFKASTKSDDAEEQRNAAEHLARSIGFVVTDSIKPKYSRWENWFLLKKGK